MNSKQRIKDKIVRGITYLASAISIFILGAILLFVFIEGLPLLNFDIIFGDNQNRADINLEIEYTEAGENFTYEAQENEYFSSRYGVAFKDSLSLEGQPTITITYISPESPWLNAKGKGNYQGEIFALKEGDILFGAGILAWGDDYLDYLDDPETQISNLPIRISQGAERLVEHLNNAYYIQNITPMILGGGIRGSIITTIYLVVLTLIIALPIGIATALYIHELAPQNKITDLLRSFIEMLTGVPSVIYGLMGAALFIPLSQSIFNKSVSSGTILSGSLTLAVIVLPVIIRATESALDVVPKDYKLASLALGANETQTTFKMMLPNAIPGILSATLLAIGRIMGESAALIYAIGAVVRDDVGIDTNGTSLAVHIWTAMAGERPNFALASTISIILLIIVLSLNMFVKLITYRFVKRYK